MGIGVQRRALAKRLLLVGALGVAIVLSQWWSMQRSLVVPRATGDNYRAPTSREIKPSRSAAKDDAGVPVATSPRSPTDTLSRVRAIRQCAALGSGFVGKLAEYLDRHYNDDDRRASRRTLMYSCESDKSGHFCGGMGDRFRGMITTFFVALLSDRRFELFHPTPARIEDFLEPHLAQYVPVDDSGKPLPREEIDKLPVDKHMMRLQHHRRFLNGMLEYDRRNVSVVRVQSNSAGIDRFVSQHPHWREARRRIALDARCNLTCYFGCLYHTLFRPSQRLESAMRSVMGTTDQPYVAVQVRVGGSWASGMRIAEPFRTPPTAIPHFVYLLQELRRNHERLPHDWFAPFGTHYLPNASIFVSSDAPRFVEEVAAMLGKADVRHVKGGYNHTDTINLGDVKPQKYAKISHDDAKEMYFLTLLNHFILSRGAHLVMAQSGFGDTAFWAARTSASAIFVDMTNNKFAWQHHLAYLSGPASVAAVKNRIVDLTLLPSPFYS